MKGDKRLLLGVGLNDADYTVTPVLEGKRVWCPYYRVWHNMLHRCYNPKYKSKNMTYKDCKVSDDWKTFSLFKEWMITQDWRGKVLDKDLLVRGNKIYSPDTCVFISSALNSALIEKHMIRGTYLSGVSKGVDCKRYQASACGRNLGSYSTEIDAHNAWRIAKAGQLKNLAAKEGNTKITQAILARVEELEELL